jgi:C-terminal processing protease CtpA/Prc
VYTDATKPDSSAFDQLEYGDIIREIDGVPVNELIESWAPYYGASNLGNFFAQVTRVMLRGKTASVTVTVDRDATEQVLTLKRIEPHAIRPTHDRDGDAFQLLSDDIAYLKLSSVKPGRAQSYIGSASKSKGFVIDIRNYPSEFFVFNLGDRFVRKSTPFARFTIGFLTDPGLFGVTDPVELKPRRPYYGGKIAVLVDETSQSQSEYTTMAYKAAPNAFVVGSQTAGADGNVSWIPLPGGHRATISGIGVYYPDGSPTQQIGIVPDIEVRPSIEGIRAGRDEVLEAAVREILGGGISDQAIKEMTRVPQAPD